MARQYTQAELDDARYHRVTCLIWTLVIVGVPTLLTLLGKL